MQITVNETGARTIAESRPMLIDGQNVYVVVDMDTASLMVGGRIVAERAVGGHMTAAAAQRWAVEYRAGQVADEAAVAEAVNPDAVHAAVVDAVHAKGAELAAHADALDESAAKPFYLRKRLLDPSDPRHPAQAVGQFRRDAAILAAWTATDEVAYARYMDDGIGATDGYYAPLDRAYWKATIGA